MEIRRNRKISSPSVSKTLPGPSECGREKIQSNRIMLSTLVIGGLIWTSMFTPATVHADTREGPDQTATVALLKAKWEGFKAALAARDIPRALEEVAVSVRPRFKERFQAMEADLSKFAASLGPIGISWVEKDMAEGVTQRSHGGETYLHYIYWSPDADGVWRIIEM